MRNRIFVKILIILSFLWVPLSTIARMPETQEAPIEISFGEFATRHISAGEVHFYSLQNAFFYEPIVVSITRLTDPDEADVQEESNFDLCVITDEKRSCSESSASKEFVVLEAPTHSSDTYVKARIEVLANSGSGDYEIIVARACVILVALIPNPEGEGGEPENEEIWLFNICHRSEDVSGWSITDEVGIIKFTLPVSTRSISIRGRGIVKILGSQFNQENSPTGVNLDNHGGTIFLYDDDLSFPSSECSYGAVQDGERVICVQKVETE